MDTDLQLRQEIHRRSGHLGPDGCLLCSYYTNTYLVLHEERVNSEVGDPANEESS